MKELQEILRKIARFSESESAVLAGWRVSVIDPRTAFTNTEKFPEAGGIAVSRAEDLPAELFKDENCASRSLS